MRPSVHTCIYTHIHTYMHYLSNIFIAILQAKRTFIKKMKISFLDTHSFQQADGFGVSEVKTKARQYLCPDISGTEISHSTSYNTAQSLSTAFHPWGI